MYNWPGGGSYVSQHRYLTMYTTDCPYRFSSSLSMPTLKANRSQLLARHKTNSNQVLPAHKHCAGGNINFFNCCVWWFSVDSKQNINTKLIHIIMQLIWDLSSDAPGPAFTVLSTLTPPSSPCLPSDQNDVSFLNIAKNQLIFHLLLSILLPPIIVCTFLKCKKKASMTHNLLSQQQNVNS